MLIAIIKKKTLVGTCLFYIQLQNMVKTKQMFWYDIEFGLYNTQSLKVHLQKKRIKCIKLKNINWALPCILLLQHLLTTMHFHHKSVSCLFFPHNSDQL